METQMQLSKIEDVKKFAPQLQDYIKSNKLSTRIAGNEYVFCDGWKFAGLTFGISAVVHEPKRVECVGDEIKYTCSCDIIRISDGATIGAGHAVCSNKESKKRGFDEYALASMSQTRAIAKGFRNLLGFVMHSAGFNTTPAEEMEEPQYSNRNHISDERIGEIKGHLEKVNNMDELKILWDGLEAHEMKDARISTLITNKKKEYATK